MTQMWCRVRLGEAKVWYGVPTRSSFNLSIQQPAIEHEHLGEYQCDNYLLQRRSVDELPHPLTLMQDKQVSTQDHRQRFSTKCSGSLNKRCFAPLGPTRESKLLLLFNATEFSQVCLTKRPSRSLGKSRLAEALKRYSLTEPISKLANSVNRYVTGVQCLPSRG